MMRLWEIFLVFLRLGCLAFGGPVAHLAYFRTTFVERRGWLSDTDLADLIAFCQFLPGPASSQTGMAIGYMRGGLAGLVLAWIGFTMPAAILMTAAAWGVQLLAREGGWVIGLHAAVLAVVFWAVLGLARRLCTDRRRWLVAILAAAVCIAVSGTLIQIIVILCGALAGMAILRRGGQEVATASEGSALAVPVKPLRIGLNLLLLLAVVGGLSLGAWLLTDPRWGMAAAFARTGVLVFGGGHVVLPLLESQVVATGWVSKADFLAGYGVAQAVPGPLFTFSAFLGASTSLQWPPVVGALICLVAIFLPSAFMVMALLPLWGSLRRFALARAALGGVGAAVVGLLAAALYRPVFTTSVAGPDDAPVLALAAFLLALIGPLRMPVWAVVPVAALLGAVLQGLGVAGFTS